MDISKLFGAVKNFKNKKIAVIGDIVLDKYVYGRVERVNPENPGAPLLKVEKKEFRLGCAANVALNIKTLEGKVSLGCVVGNDQNAFVFENLCAKNGIELIGLRDGETIIKERTIESEFNKYLLRTDDGESNLKYISEKSARILYRLVDSNKFDALILSDYDKIIFKGGFGKTIVGLARKKNIPVMVDPKPANAYSFQFSTLLCPNIKEAREIIGVSDGDEKETAKKLREIVNSKYVAVTCGKKGIICYDGCKFTHAPTKVREVIDVTGAGDTVCAVITLGLVSGLDLAESAYLANYAAGVVVEKQGTSSLTKDELVSRINGDANI